MTVTRLGTAATRLDHHPAGPLVLRRVEVGHAAERDDALAGVALRPEVPREPGSGAPGNKGTGTPSSRPVALGCRAPPFLLALVAGHGIEDEEMSESEQGPARGIYSSPVYALSATWKGRQIYGCKWKSQHFERCIGIVSTAARCTKSLLPPTLSTADH